MPLQVCKYSLNAYAEGGGEGEARNTEIRKKETNLNGRVVVKCYCKRCYPVLTACLVCCVSHAHAFAQGIVNPSCK